MVIYARYHQKAMKKELKLLAGIIILGVILRCLELNSRSIQYDDAFSVLLAGRSLQEIISGTAADTMPPFFYFILHFWMVFGNQLWFLRLLTVLLSLGCIIFIYLTVREISDCGSALWSSFITAISPLQIYHAQDIRMYALLALSQVAYYFFFTRFYLGRGKSQKVSWLGMIFFGTLAMYTHNLAIFGLVVPHFFLAYKKNWRLLAKLLMVSSVIILFSIPWLFLVPGQISKIQNAFWTPKPGFIEIFQAVIMFVATLPLPGVWIFIGAIVSVQVFALAIFVIWKERKHSAEISFLIFATLVPPSLLFIVSYLMRPVFVPRGFLVASLGFYGLLGWAISKTTLKGVGSILLGLFILAAIISLPYQIPYKEFPRSPFFETVQYIKANVKPGDLIIHDNKLSFFPCYYYSEDLPQTFIKDESGSQNDTLAPQTQKALGIYPQPDIERAVEGKTHFYYVVFQRVIDEYKSMGLPDHPILSRLKNIYDLQNVSFFNDLSIYEFFSRKS
jgi:mannosyltransferase